MQYPIAFIGNKTESIINGHEIMQDFLLFLVNFCVFATLANDILGTNMRQFAPINAVLNSWIYSSLLACKTTVRGDWRDPLITNVRTVRLYWWTLLVPCRRCAGGPVCKSLVWHFYVSFISLIFRDGKEQFGKWCRTVTPMTPR